MSARCGLGTCTEQNAIIPMLASGESKIKEMLQVNEGNSDALVVIEKNKAIKLEELLPFPWEDAWKGK